MPPTLTTTPTATRRLERTVSRAQGSAQRRLETLRGLVDRVLEQSLPKATMPPQVVHEGMRYCVLSGGKRFRPLLCLGACEAVGTSARHALSVACALELLHTYSLVHDDLPAMDNADQRRGQPSCHRKFGEGNAILIGDALLTMAFEWLSRPHAHAFPRPASYDGRGGRYFLRRPRQGRGARLSRNGTTHCLEIIQTVSQACGTTGLIGGQVLDLQAISQPQTATERTLRDVAQRKTGALITASVIAGGLAGGMRASALQQLQRYGQGIGLAFQLIDDVHDREGLAQVLGADGARAEAVRLADRAIAALEPFGTRAVVLRQLANWLITTT